MNEMSKDITADREAAATAPADPVALLNEILMEQALSLNAMFVELAGDAAESRPYEESTATYTRLALRAQTNCRASLEAMVRADRAAQRALREVKK